MSESIEMKFIRRSSFGIEMDPSMCLQLNNENTIKNEVVIPLYEHIKDSTSFDILSRTSLTYVPRFIIRMFPKLRQLRMINAGITTLTSESFQSGEHLELIDMRDNQIIDIPMNVLVNLSRLKDVNLANNQISHIEPGAFDNIPSLTTLILSNNLLRIIEARSFTGAKNLHELYLESNSIRQIEMGALDLANLEILSLNNNRLVSIRQSTFENARKLESIDLSGNDLVELVNSLKKCSTVYSLNLNDNPDLKDADLFELTTIMPNLSYLHLANTGFKFNQHEQVNATDMEKSANFWLTHLDLSTNNLSSPDILLHLSHFKSLKTIIHTFESSDRIETVISSFELHPTEK